MASDRRSVTDFSLGWLTLGNASPLQVIDAAAAAGFGHVSLRLASRVKEQAPGLAADPQAVREVQAALQANGVSLLHMGGIWLDGMQPVAAFEPAIAIGARLGARMCVGIFTPERQPVHIREELADLCRLAARHGMRVAVEFAAYLGVRTIAEALALVESCGEPNAGLLIDTLHLFRSGGHPVAVGALPPERVFFAQLSDAPLAAPNAAQLQTEARGNRLDIGLGELPLADLMRALPVRAPLEIEAPCLAYRNMGPTERARLAADAVRTFFETDQTPLN
jgi:sugar phosphate isomerase/epimerase